MKIVVSSPAFAEGQRIPAKYTGDGVDLSPPIQWSGVPEEAKELVLLCEDPDAPTADPWVHWLIYKIPANLTGLSEGIEKKGRLKDPPGALQGKNSWPAGQTLGYRGPMPPSNHGPHRYFFKVYALEAKLVTQPGRDKKAVMEEIRGHVLAEGQMMGTYER